MPTLRFNIDSNRSPTMPTAATARPRHDPRWHAHLWKPPVSDNREAERSADESAHRALDGFLRAHNGRQQMSAEHPPAVILKRVADRDGQDEQQRRFPARASSASLTATRAARRYRAERTRRWPPSAARRRPAQPWRCLGGVPERQGREAERRSGDCGLDRQVRASRPRHTQARRLPAPAGRDTWAPARAAMSMYSRNASSDDDDRDAEDRRGGRNQIAATTAASSSAPLITRVISQLLVGPHPTSCTSPPLGRSAFSRRCSAQ